VNTSSGFPWTVRTFGGAGGSPFAGSYYASTGCVGAPCISGTAAQQASLSQTLDTIVGQTYDLSFEFSTDNNGASNELQVLWNGSVVLDLGPGGTLGQIPTYQLFSVSGLTATSSSTTLTFLGRQDPGYDALDNVVVEAGAATAPEPSVLFLVGVLFSILWVARRRAVVSSKKSLVPRPAGSHATGIGGGV
jgi:hypothetical protein